jgi:hypothetical protein
VPAARPLVLQPAVFVLPLPESATAAHPPIVLPPSVKATLPVGALPVTVAVKVTFVPAVDGLSELTRLVVLAALFTVWVSALLVEPALAPSPP